MLKYIISIFSILTLGYFLVFTVPPKMQTTKDYNHAGKTYNRVIEDTQARVISIVESYIPSSSRREHLNYIPPDLRDKNGRLITYRMAGDTIASDVDGIYAELQKVPVGIVETHSDVSNFTMDVTHFYGGSLAGDVPEITIKIRFKVKSIVKNNETEYEEIIPMKVNMVD